MSKKRTSGRPTGKRSKANLIAAAVDLAGGVSKVARACGVTRQTVYGWIEEWRVERLVDALKLSELSGVPIEKFAGKPVGRRSAASSARRRRRDG